jgi:hypothetical protein
MKKIDVETFIEMLQEDLVEFEENVHSGTFQNRNAHEWFKLLNDWVEYGFSRRATEEWEEFGVDEDDN